MLNPSTADGSKDDRTITRCCNFAKSNGYGGIIVCNLFAYRSTDPSELLLADDPVGPRNYSAILLTESNCEAVVCAWGNYPIIKKLAKKLGRYYNPIKHLEKPLYALELSKDGTPKHPLYLKSNISLIPYKLSL